MSPRSIQVTLQLPSGKGLQLGLVAQLSSKKLDVGFA